MSNDDIVYFLFLSIVLSCLLHVYLLDTCIAKLTIIYILFLRNLDQNMSNSLVI